MAKARISGYGPPDLIDQLKEMRWLPCSSEARNFDGVGLGGYYLTKPRDEMRSVEYRLIVKDENSGKEFSIEGFSFPAAILGFAVNLQEEKAFKPNEFAFAGHRLSKKQQDGQAFYSVTLEII